MKQIQFTTMALEDNQYLLPQHHSSIVETYCIGFTLAKRDKRLDGYYFTKELFIKTSLDNFNNDNYNEHINATIKPL